MKILFINLPYYGHVVPTIGLVQELIKQGCEVTYLISSKGPLSIFKYKWIAKAFTKDIAKDIPLKTDNWLDEIIYNPPELNLIYTLREYQPYEEEFSREQYKFLGPSIYERKTDGFEWEKSNKPLIYISLGTVLKGDVSFFQNCIEAFRDENVEVIVSVGKQFKVKKLNNIPSNIHIYESVPQIEVLSRADIFVTHGGMNSVSEALVYGVPMVVIPFVSDQPVNARCVEKLGAGKTLECSKISKDILKNMVLSVLSDKEMHNNLAKIQQVIKESPGNKGGAAMITNYYEKRN